MSDITPFPGGREELDNVDWDAALLAVDGRRELLAELVGIFFQEYPGLCHDLERAVERQDAGQLKISAHRLKGCLRYFGNSQASRLAEQLEMMGRSGRVEEAAALYAEFNAALRRLLPALRVFRA